MSRPSRARGLKPLDRPRHLERGVVAPLTGAWIETPHLAHGWHGGDVAPLTGAWIETKASPEATIRDEGRAPHGRVD